jgi:hypothetical protein
MRDVHTAMTMMCMVFWHVMLCSLAARFLQNTFTYHPKYMAYQHLNFGVMLNQVQCFPTTARSFTFERKVNSTQYLKCHIIHTRLLSEQSVFSLIIVIFLS